MRQLTISIPDNHASFFLKVVKAFDFVKVEKNIKVEEPSLSAEQKRILDGISEAVNEVNLHKQGKIKLQSGDEFLNELKREGYL
ncbi:hypothetical protein VB796_04490 [Arcicella sp. LKC2W]|uniref:hypothetical protein n=1 Tax=Arcicella sp. LKC2W TaxID=2984198 RepID=UPI002B21DF9D|nr:hypothetical protein [Arcicella sp. LKC2W]MEA5458280.1 hypothetical protein [Arcicella sp. LKC2W]